MGLPRRTVKKIQTAGAVLVGAGAILELFGLIEEDEPSSSVGDSQVDAAMRKALPAPQILTRSVKHTEIRGLPDRIKYIKALLMKGSESPAVRNAAASVLNKRCGNSWCVPAKDAKAEVKAMWIAVTDPRSALSLRYTRDHRTVDQYHAADKLMKLKIGDCDDFVIYLGALLRSIGYPLRLRVIQTKNAQTWSHIYLLVGLPPANPTTWFPLDPTMPEKGPGWEAPSSMVVKVKDFDV